LEDWEEDRDHIADYRLGIAAIEVGRSLHSYYTYGITNFRGINIGFVSSGGMKPSEVGDWILNNLKE
jgi:hypothetical protein